VESRDREAQRQADERRYERDKPKRIEKQKKVNAKNWEKDAPKRKARAAAALKGKASACANCGSTKNLEGHHPDYSKPSKVQTLCSKCHGAQHQGAKE
jgi:hypothetical protein